MRVLYVILLFLMAGCSIQPDQLSDLSKLDSLTYENRALEFFIDSLLYKEGLFGRENDGVFRDLPFMDSAMYASGLFKNNEIIYSLISTSISKPPIDSSEIVFLTPEDAKIQTDLYTNYKKRISTGDTTYLVAHQGFKVLSWYDYVSNLKEYTNGMYLIVHGHISGGGRNYVQLEFRDVDQHDMFFTHNFYIELDSQGKVLNWSLNY